MKASDWEDEIAKSLRAAGIGGRHALTIGATGMLSQATLQLAKVFDRVTVASRNPEAFCRLHAQVCPSLLLPLQVDYLNISRFVAAILRQRTEYGHYNFALIWIHSKGRSATEWLIRDFSQRRHETHVLHVHPSSASQDEAQQLHSPSLYQSVLLGRKRENGGFRWLNHREISEGVIEALVSGRPFTILGEA